MLREAEFLSVASETIHGIATRRPEKVVDRQRTFYGQNQKETLSPRCLLCYKNHMFLKCPEFQRMNIQGRWKSIKRLNLCYGCLGKNHVLQNCKKVKKCGVDDCPKLHHYLLHKSDVKVQEGNIEEENHLIKTDKNMKKSDEGTYSKGDIENRTMVAKSLPSEWIAMRTIPVLIEHASRKLQVNALLDDCSTKTYINADIAAELGLEGKRELINVGVLNGGCEQFETQPVNFLLRSLDGNLSKDVTAYTAKEVTGNLQAIPWEQIKQKWSYLPKISFPIIKSRQVDMLIGLDYLELHQSIQEVCGPPGEPIARLTPLGWTCTGILPQGKLFNPTYLTYFAKNANSNDVMLRSIDQSLQRFWEIEDYEHDEVIASKPQDNEALLTVKESLKWTGDRYEVSIPWKLNPAILPSSYEMALKRLKNIEKRLLKEHDLGLSYCNLITSYIDKGYISKAKKECVLNSQQWLLPHFPVLRPDKPTSKVRIVFDASAKCENFSLNDVIDVGPKLQRDLIDVLLRFRKGAVAMVCDIAEMYLQIGVAEKDKYLLLLIIVKL